MAAVRVCALTAVLFFLAGFLLKKPVFTSGSDGISLTLCDVVHGMQETYSYSSLYVIKDKYFIRFKTRSLVILLLLSCGDIESCPGPDNSLGNFIARKGIKLFHQNCRGLASCLPNLTSLFTGRRNVIITLSETHITHNTDSMFNIPGFDFTQKRRQSGKGGGVGVYISENIKWKRREDLENELLENIWIEICPEKAKHFLVCCMYRPPDQSVHLNKNWQKYFKQQLETVNDLSLEVIIMGDFNINYKSNNNDNREFKDQMLALGYEQ